MIGLILSVIELTAFILDWLAVCLTGCRYVKTNGELRMQKGLSRERTSYRSLNVPCDESVVLVCCRKLIVWAVSEERKVLVRHGVDNGTEEGCSWHRLQG